MTGAHHPDERTFIGGWVEFFDGKAWRPSVRIDDLGNEERPYNFFALLFGVRNYAGFSPVCGIRGIPDNASLLSREIFEAGRDRLHSPSWTSLSELKGIKFSKIREIDDPFPHYYRAGDGLEVSLVATDLTMEERKRLSKEKVLKKGPILAKIEKLRRKDILTKGWLVIVAMMEALASAYGQGEDSVRVVVWFREEKPRSVADKGRELGRSVYP